MKHEIEAVELISLSAKALGMIGQEKSSNIYFRTRFGIHTFGLKSAIDIVICDDAFHVRQTRSELPPLRLFFWNWRFQNVIELPSGEVKKRGITPESQVILHILRTI